MFSLHNHSDYSNARGGLDAINTIPGMVQYSFELGLSGIALTDHDVLSGHLKFAKEIEKMNKKGKALLEQNPNDIQAKRMSEFKGILGNEIYLLEDDILNSGKKFFRHFILLAKDLQGWYQLNQISSRAWGRMYVKGITRTPTFIEDLQEIVGNNPGHLIATTACLGNYLGDRIIKFGTSQGELREKLKLEIINHIEQIKNIFQDDFYLEVQPGQSKEQLIYNQGIAAFAKFTNTPMVVTTDSHYPKAELRKVHEAYLKSQNAERETADFYDYTYLMSEKEVRELLSASLESKDIDDCIANTIKIGNQIEQYSIVKAPVIPKVPYKNQDKWANAISKYNMDFWNKFAQSKYPEDQFLLYQICEGIDYLQSKGWFEVNDTTLRRIDVELQQIWEVSEKLNQRMSTYFTTMQDIVNEIWKISIVAPGRGSAGAFLINYLLQITQIDPLPFDFPYKRFMAADKASLADIDIDSGASKKKEIFDHLSKHFESFGNILTGIATFGTEKSKSALLTACRGLEYEPEEGLYFASLIPSDRGFPRSLKVCYYGDGEDKKPVPEFVQAMDENPKVWEIAQQIEGLINKRSSHAAGIAIFPKDSFFEQVGLMKTPAGFLITQFDLGCLEEVGVVKYDLLSTDAVDSIQTCLYLLADQGYIEWDGNLRDVYNKYLHPKVIDYSSKEMWEQVHRKEVLSLFQLT